MFIRVLSLFLALVATIPAVAQSVTLPAEVRGAPGAWIILVPDEVDGGPVRWRLDPALQEVKLDRLLPGLDDKLKGKVVTASAGKYKAEAWNAKDNQASAISTCWVIVGDGGPFVPPPPPLPVADPLIDSVKAAYQREFSPTKTQEAADFAAVYEVGINSTAKTLGALYAEIGAEAKKRNLGGKLPEVQKTINAELKLKLPNPTTHPDLTIEDAESRALIRTQFGRARTAFLTLSKQ